MDVNEDGTKMTFRCDWPDCNANADWETVIARWKYCDYHGRIAPEHGDDIEAIT